VTTQFLYSGNDIVLESGASGVVAYLRSLNIDEPFVRQTGSGNEYYHTDSLGSVLALTGQTGASQTTYNYEAFGKTTITGTSTNPFQYTGRESDGTGLYYYRARYYSPQMQRFLTEDPIRFGNKQADLYGELLNDLSIARRISVYPAGLDEGANVYAYVLNDPVNFLDSLGLFYYKKGVPPAGPDVEKGLSCMDSCLGVNLGISGGGEKKGHKAGSQHYNGKAADISYRLNPDLVFSEKKVMCCALKCGFEFGQSEANHFHIQTVPGENNSKGALPKNTCGCN
jgi:RHS repeat-associated protein